MSEKEEEKKFEPLEIDDPAVAKARSVKKLSGGDAEDSNRRVLSNLKGDGEVYRLRSMYVIADVMPNYFGFLNLSAKAELELRASLQRKGVRGRDDIVNVVKEPAVPAGGGLLGKVGGFIRGGQ
jgi:hypothetical protein